MIYSKLPTNTAEQLTLLAKRGMEISPDAEHFLAHIGYYRLRGYWMPFELADSSEGDHVFKEGVSFNDVLNLYFFDRELRLLVTDAIERIEVSIRNQWVEVLADRYGAHAYLKSDIFSKSRQFGRSLAELSSAYERSKETHIKHYKRRYGEPDLPPIWAAVDIMTMGQFSNWLSNLKSKSIKSCIAGIYGLDEKALCSFVHHLTVIRNICAHHGRLWNRSVTVTMALPRSKPIELKNVIVYGPDPNQAPRKIYNTLVMLVWFLDRICPEHNWKNQLIDLIDQYGVDVNAIGFPSEWHQMAFWRGEKKDAS